jgi:hypothetical protein
MTDLSQNHSRPTVDRKALQAALSKVFRTHGVSVAVGLISDGIAIRSQDHRVDAVNLEPLGSHA